MVVGRREPLGPVEGDGRPPARLDLQPGGAAEQLADPGGDRQVESPPLGGRAGEPLELLRAEFHRRDRRGGRLVDDELDDPAARPAARPEPDGGLTGRDHGVGQGVLERQPDPVGVEGDLRRAALGQLQPDRRRSGPLPPQAVLEEVREEAPGLELGRREMRPPLEEPTVVGELGEHLLDLAGVLGQEGQILLEVGGPLGDRLVDRPDRQADHVERGPEVVDHQREEPAVDRGQSGTPGSPGRVGRAGRAPRRPEPEAPGRPDRERPSRRNPGHGRPAFSGRRPARSSRGSRSRGPGRRWPGGPGTRRPAGSPSTIGHGQARPLTAEGLDGLRGAMTLRADRQAQGGDPGAPQDVADRFASTSKIRTRSGTVTVEVSQEDGRRSEPDEGRSRVEMGIEGRPARGRDPTRRPPGGKLTRASASSRARSRYRRPRGRTRPADRGHTASAARRPRSRNDSRVRFAGKSAARVMSSGNRSLAVSTM